MKAVEEVGLIKFDFLGLKTLTTISKALEYIKASTGTVIDMDTVPLDDEPTFDSLRRGDNVAVFQLEASSGIRDLTVKVRPNNIEDISAINAIYRPGPLGAAKLTDYLTWRAGETQAIYHHKDLEPILGTTGGWIIYQEQVLRIARDLAGYTLAEADLLRRAVGKKKKEEMDAQFQKLMDGMKAKGYPAKLGEVLWEEIKAFADYGFNKSHAIAYSLMTYKTAYLKTHYPVEFMAAALTCDQDNQDKKIIYVQECKRMGIPVLPPDINESGLDFTPANGTIRFGLSAIKNVGEAAVHILEERKNRGSFKDLFDFAERVDLGIVNKKKLDSLVLAGAFDFTHHNRATLIMAVDLIWDYKDEMKKYVSKLETFEKKSEQVRQRELDIKAGKLSEKGKKLAALKPPEEPVKPTKPDYVLCTEFTRRDLLRDERELTGSFISGHPLDGLSRKKVVTIKSLKENQEQPEVATLLAIISDIELKETKTKHRMAFLGLEDLTGTVDSVIFPRVYRKFEDLLIKNVPLIIHAKVEYRDVDGEEEGTSVAIPSLDIQQIELVQSHSLEIAETLVDVPLQMDNIIELNKAIHKTGLGDNKVRLRFVTKSDTQVFPTDLLSVSNERTFRTELYKARK
jgi:DNA polymerase-3 subunit alpha